MTHEKYPKSNCPLDGKLCPHKKILNVTELNKGNTFSFGICKNCCQQWKDNCSNKKLTPVHKPEQSNFFDVVKNLTNNIFNTKNKEQSQNILNPMKAGYTHNLPAEVPISAEMLEQILFGTTGGVVKPDIKCPNCNTTLSEMTKQNRISCPHCYDTFRKELEPLIKKYHNSLKHVGKVPKNWENKQMQEIFSTEELLKDKIASLKKIQKDAISEENYEKAGELKKDISRLEEKLSNLDHFPPLDEKSDSSQQDPSPPKTDEDQ